MDTLGPQPAKKRCSELGVPLHLPEGVVIPPFYEEERDASVISTALRLGADAVCHLQSQAEELRLQELLDKKVSELTQRVEELDAELSLNREKVNEEVNRRVAEQTLALRNALQVRDGRVADLESACQEQREVLVKHLGNLGTQMEDMRQLNANLQAVRAEERQKACGVHSTLQVHETRVADHRGRIKSLIGDAEEREQLADNQTTVRVEDAHERPERGKPSPYVKKDTDSKLRELVVQAFEKASDFELQKTSEDRAMASICKLQTSWYRRDQTNVKQEVDLIKSELAVHPEVDVAFLVALQVGIAGHTEHLFDVELLKTGQALAYVNQFTADDNPAKTLQVFACPLLGTLLRIKQVCASSGTNAASHLRRSASQWVETVRTQLTELNSEREELLSDMSKSEQQFKARNDRIDKRIKALNELLQDMKPSCAT